MLDKARNFVKESRQELKRVNWPTRNETVRLTLIVIGISLLIAAFLGLADFVLSSALKNFFLN